MGWLKMQVTYLDHLGSDLTVVNAARVSFNKRSTLTIEEYSEWGDHPVFGYIKMGKEREVLKEADQKLIKYLASHHHWLPFRHPTVSFHCKAPIFVARQAGKHQVGMTWSEVSRRYVDDPPEFYTPEVWRKRADDKKQGSTDEPVTELVPLLGTYSSYTPEENYEDVVSFTSDIYSNMLESGVAPEQARMVLPQSMYTEWVWTGSLLSWAHFVKQRTYPDAQKEIQEFASLFIPTLEGLYPHSWSALMDFYQA
jgi:thymidylate synthase (FAD)